MQWFQARQQVSPKHKYAINAELLGDPSECAWTNLGYWFSESCTYPQACQSLAEHLANSIHLNSKDRVLDLGCGQGAALSLWKNQYNVQYIDAVDMQLDCVNNIIHTMPFIHQAQCGSFLNLKEMYFEFKFDAVLCIDAAYHSHLNSFLSSVKSVLNSKARIGFHYLVLSDGYKNLNSFEKLKLAALLKSADIKLNTLNSYSDTQKLIERCGFEQIEMQNLSAAVLNGFAAYIRKSKTIESAAWSIDRFKIQMTAKLCQKLYEGGLVDYVQISAVNAE